MNIETLRKVLVALTPEAQKEVRDEARRMVKEALAEAELYRIPTIPPVQAMQGGGTVKIPTLEEHIQAMCRSPEK